MRSYNRAIAYCYINNENKCKFYQLNYVYLCTHTKAENDIIVYFCKYLCVSVVSSNFLVNVLHSTVSFSMSCLWPWTMPSNSVTVATTITISTSRILYKRKSKNWPKIPHFNKFLIAFLDSILSYNYLKTNFWIAFCFKKSSWINYWQRQLIFIWYWKYTYQFFFWDVLIYLQNK